MGGDLDTISLGDAKGCKDCVGGMAGRVGDLGDVCTIPLGMLCLGSVNGIYAQVHCKNRVVIFNPYRVASVAILASENAHLSAVQ